MYMCVDDSRSINGLSARGYLRLISRASLEALVHFLNTECCSYDGHFCRQGGVMDMMRY